jgi:hypothetical protein
VADYHTYFVGREEWGFAVWAHNTCGAFVKAATSKNRVTAEAARRQYFRIKAMHPRSPQKRAEAMTDYLQDKAGFKPNTAKLAKAVEDSMVRDSKKAGNQNTAAGNDFHYDRLNGASGRRGPSQLQNRYPQTEFAFARRGQKQAEVRP